MHGIDQKLCIRWIWKDLQFCGKCLFHSKIISRKQAKRNMRSHLNTKKQFNGKERRGPVRDAHPATLRGGGFRVRFV
jgi:ribosomal protein S26